MVRAAEVSVEGVEVMPATRRAVPISLRVPPELAKRVDKLAARLAKESGFGALGIMNKSGAIKVILSKGCDALEAELEGK